MDYTNTETLEAVTLEAVQQAFPNTTFPADNPPAPFAVLTVEPQPPFDPMTQECVAAPPALVDGAWVRGWSVFALSLEVLAERQQEAAAAVQAQIVMATQARLDAFAQTRGYDDIKSLVTYANDPDPVFASEGQYGLQVRSQTWATVRAIRDAVLAGTRPLPSGYAEIEPELPVLAWPGSNA